MRYIGQLFHLRLSLGTSVSLQDVKDNERHIQRVARESECIMYESSHVSPVGLMVFLWVYVFLLGLCFSFGFIIFLWAYVFPLGIRLNGI